MNSNINKELDLSKSESKQRRRPRGGCYYHSYLQLDRIIDSQHPLSIPPAHDEHLFIIVHQSYELWFKQILHELDSCLEMLNQPQNVPEKDLLVVVSRLSRVTEIQRVLLSQLRILETMTPMDFLSFRDALFPASGFQSIQFKLIENRLGLRSSQRLLYNRSSYTSALSEDHAQLVENSEAQLNLFDAVESWLERTPLSFQGFDFWNEFQKSVESMHRDEDTAIAMETDPTIQKTMKDGLRDSILNFESIFNSQLYESQRNAGERRLSHKAFQAALSIMLLRDEPLFQMPFQLLTHLLDIDEHLTAWRHGHANMVHRMLGMKIGTGGSSGYRYLKATASHHKIFADYFNMSQYLIPSTLLPILPNSVRQRLGFRFRTDSTPPPSLSSKSLQ